MMPSISGGAALLAAFARSRAPAASATALFRNQQADGAADAHGVRDFDFLPGRGRVRNERLRERLAGCSDWQRFDAILECRPVLGGLGNIDEFVTDELGPGVFLGMSLRLFDAVTRRWSIWWASNRSGRLEPPVVGRFVDGVGCFEGDDVHDGTPVRVRYVWSGIGAAHARWEQAFSTDEGRTWEPNWRMRLTRLSSDGTEIAS